MYLFLALPAHRPAPPSSQPVRGPNKNGEIVFTKSADLSSTGARIAAMCNGAMGKLNPPVQPYYPLYGLQGGYFFLSREITQAARNHLLHSLYERRRKQCHTQLVRYLFVCVAKLTVTQQPIRASESLNPLQHSVAGRLLVRHCNRNGSGASAADIPSPVGRLLTSQQT